MNKTKTRKIAFALSALLITWTASGCSGCNTSAPSSSASITASPEQLDEQAICDAYTGIVDTYIKEGAKTIDYLAWVLYDDAIVKNIKADSTNVDTAKAGTYKIAYTVTIDRSALDAYKNGKKPANTSGTNKETIAEPKTETVVIEKEVTVVGKDEAQNLADKNIPVYTDKGETIKKSDGSEVKTEQKAPASTTVTGGTVIDASTKEEVKPTEVAKPTATPKPTEDPKKTDKKEETNKTEDKTSGTSNSNSGTTTKPSTGGTSGSSNSGNTSGSNSGSKPSSGSSNNSQPAHTHTWVDVTTTINHPAVTHEEDVYENQQVLVTPAWDEQVYTETVSVCRQCGFQTTIASEMTEHCVENGHSCTSYDNYETVHHDAVYETQSVKVGTRTVVDQEAWTETVVTGQKCTGCGATK